MGFFSRKKIAKKTPQKSWQNRDRRIYPAGKMKEPKKKESRFSRFLFWLLLIVFLGVCLYIFFFSPFLNIDVISVEGETEIPKDQIESQVDKALEGKNFQFFPKRNIFFASRKGIVKAISHKFNRLEILSVEKKFPKNILIRVMERKAEIAFCSGGVCYFVDKTGFVYGGANENEESLRGRGILVLIDDSARPVEMGETRISSSIVEYLAEITKTISKDFGIEISESFHTPGIASLEVSIKTNEDWFLKLDSRMTPEETKKIIQVVFEKELDGEKRKSLEYLDLRIKGKVYYKMKN